MSDDMTPEGFKNFEDLLKKIEETLSRHSKKIKEHKMNEDKNKKDDMVWFSMSPDMEFINTSPTEWGSTEPPVNSAEEMPFANDVVSQVSPDLSHFMGEAGHLFYDALYMPFRTGKGRLTDFFTWVERARDRMEQEDFTQTDRNAFTNWCRAVAGTLLKAQTKHGLWLTDDEEDLVSAMSKGIFTDGEYGGGK